MTESLSDFGFSQWKKPADEFFKTDTFKPKGNVMYMAPEVMMLKNFK